jgi:7-cyano-7-deazaguanine synthase in queuosine biosynthesis
MTDVVMVSGGLDSFLAAALLPRAKRVFVEWGQPYLAMERVAVADLHPTAHVVRMEGLPRPPADDPYIPARNLMFATIGARFGSRVCLAGVRDEMCADKSPDAFKDMGEILTSQCRSPVEVFSPLWGRTKDEAVSDFLREGGDPEVLKRTLSCYGDGASPCLDCEACFRRFVALRSNGVDVPRPRDATFRSYGLHKLQSSPLATAHAILRALHASGTPVVGVPLDEAVSGDGDAEPGSLRIVYTKRRSVPADVIRSALSENGVRFDAVMSGVPDRFFRMKD